MENKSKVMHGDIEVRDALRWITDILDCSQINYMIGGELVKQIAEDASKIAVDKIQILIPTNSWNVTTQSLFKTFLPGADLNDLHYVSYNVPIELKIVKRKYEFLKNPDVAYFWVDEYKIPNPWQKYYKSRFIVQ